MPTLSERLAELIATLEAERAAINLRRDAELEAVTAKLRLLKGAQRLVTTDLDATYAQLVRAGILKEM